ncbi:MAG: hypothetical protein COX17_11060 [Deltaproteobacteria bacterium CG23_combo_of_CG06-09_8_20_14_all_60_8]|nr:MAG: hypothetical protein COX17_11060 [Deltaproteobacteria bacterium CG23_combo_of_CG06-09_8_20_14_all_60_8]
MQCITRKTLSAVPAMVLCACLLLTAGCSQMNPWSPAASSPSAPAAQSSNEPYYPTEFRDLLIPGEMELVRDNSMIIKTDAFFGGILNFTGRVEVSSLTNFFVSSMVNNHWKMTGSLEGKTVLLSFIKPQETCMINIVEGEYGLKTNIYVYITKDLSGGGGSQEIFNY